MVGAALRMGTPTTEWVGAWFHWKESCKDDGVGLKATSLPCGFFQSAQRKLLPGGSLGVQVLYLSSVPLLRNLVADLMPLGPKLVYFLSWLIFFLHCWAWTLGLDLDRLDH